MQRLSFTLLLLVFTFCGFAQSELEKELENEEVQESGFDKSRMYYGGYMNLSFGTYTVIGIQPLVGYKFTPQLSAGIQLLYEYTSYDNTSGSNYGGSLFGRYRIFPQLYAHAEFSGINYGFNSIEYNRIWVPFLYLGGGYSQPISKNVWLNAQVLFDVLQDENSPYDSWEPFFSIGFGVGF